MPDNNEIARDLTVIYLQKHSKENVSMEELLKEYKETHKKFEDILKDPPAKVKILDRRALGL